MAWQFTLFSLPILFALVVSIVLFGYILTFYRDGRRDPIVILYAWITVAAIIWIGFSALKLLHTDPATKLLFYRFLHIGAAALPPLMFLFAIAFTDRHQWLRFEIVGAVFLIPAVFIVFIFFEPDGLIIAGTNVIDTDLVILRVADGPGFILFLVYSAFLAVATFGFVLAEIRRVGPTYAPQATLLGIAVMTPIVFTVLTTVGIPPFAGDSINLVPTSAAVSVGSFGLLLYRYRLVDLPPLAHATAMKYSPDALFVLDREGRVVDSNEHGNDLLAVIDGEVGSPLSDALPEFDPISISNELIEITTESGDLTYYRVFGEPLVRGEKRVGWVVVLRDETEQQQQQQRLQQKNEQMELFASTISHDLRNPLGVAQGYLEIAKEDSESEELERVDAALSRMEEIIDEILTLARAGRQIDDLEAVQVDAVVEAAWESVTTDSAALSVDVGQTVSADPTMIQHVFENLFRNAIEHGGEDVTVTVGDLEAGIYVEDDGDGIPQANREAVFEVGYTTKPDGTGFGLSITKQIVDAHDWEIRVTEGSEGGTRFEITDVEVAE